MHVMTQTLIWCFEGGLYPDTDQIFNKANDLGNCKSAPDLCNKAIIY